ncbi:MAG: hypothetical protein M0O96_03470 [Desulforhopalus sp.]|nr:hypothetical protein [Desulforhopalus sp.]
MKMTKRSPKLMTPDLRKIMIGKVAPSLFGVMVWCGCIAVFVVKLGQMP